MKDILDSIKYNFIERTTNPFLLTYLVVMLLRNWELLFMLFNFDSGRPLTNKVNMITTYLNHRNVWLEIWTNTWISFLILVGTYLLLIVSRLIVNIYHKKALPKVYEWTDNSAIVLRSFYDSLKKELDAASTLIDVLRENKSKLDSIISEQENTIGELRSKIAQLESENKKQDSGITEKIDINLEKNFEKIEKVVNKLKEKEEVDNFKNLVIHIFGGGGIASDKVKKLSFFIELDLIVIHQKIGLERYFKLTELGEEVYKYLQENE